MWGYAHNILGWSCNSPQEQQDRSKILAVLTTAVFTAAVDMGSVKLHEFVLLDFI